ncbi:MAG: alginate export family protein [Betaproteobacteria bacterium]|nr:alginate export family protein [Betaproteobacteria bacterium]
MFDWIIRRIFNGCYSDCYRIRLELFYPLPATMTASSTVICLALRSCRHKPVSAVSAGPCAFLRRNRALLACGAAWLLAAGWTPEPSAQGMPQPAAEATGFVDRWLSADDFYGQVRLRYNNIEESDRPRRTEGWTVRLVGGWQRRLSSDFKLAIDAIHTDHIGAKDFNDNVALAGTSPYPLLPDPRNSDLNQAYLDYSGLPSTRIRAGKQIVRLGNQRFISDNDFRQTPTVFNGALVSNTSLPATEAQVGYFQRIRTALGKQAQIRLTLFDLAHNPAPGHSISLYGYFLDQDRSATITGFANNSHRTLGVRAEGSFAVGDPERERAISYIAEVGRQDSYAGGDSRINAAYWRLGAGVSNVLGGLRLDHEVKGSNQGVYGLQTPLTDLYAFNGWALQFTTTPALGLRDTWATVRSEFLDDRLVFRAEFHRYRSDFGGLEFGREVNIGGEFKIRGNLAAQLQHARFRPGDGLAGGKQVDKTWLTFNFIF